MTLPHIDMSIIKRISRMDRSVADVASESAPAASFSEAGIEDDDSRPARDTCQRCSVKIQHEHNGVRVVYESEPDAP